MIILQLSTWHMFVRVYQCVRVVGSSALTVSYSTVPWRFLHEVIHFIFLFCRSHTAGPTLFSQLPVLLFLRASLWSTRGTEDSFLSSAYITLAQYVMDWTCIYMRCGVYENWQCRSGVWLKRKLTISPLGPGSDVHRGTCATELDLLLWSQRDVNHNQRLERGKKNLSTKIQPMIFLKAFTLIKKVGMTRSKHTNLCLAEKKVKWSIVFVESHCTLSQRCSADLQIPASIQVCK